MWMEREPVLLPLYPITSEIVSYIESLQQTKSLKGPYEYAWKSHFRVHLNPFLLPAYVTTLISP